MDFNRLCDVGIQVNRAKTDPQTDSSGDALAAEDKTAPSRPEGPAGAARHGRSRAGDALGRASAFKKTANSRFDQWSDTYDHSWLTPLVFKPSYLAMLEEILFWREAGGTDAPRHLDVGCGTGTFAAMTHELGVSSFGLDYSEAMARRASRKLAALNLSNPNRVFVGDSEHLPFPDASWDLLTCAHSFHHYPHQQAVVREFRRVLRPGGRLILVDGFRDNVVGWFVYDVIVALVEKDVDHAPWHRLARMAREAGFTRISHRKVNLLAPLLVFTATA